jgi:hypothetical protein
MAGRELCACVRVGGGGRRRENMCIFSPQLTLVLCKDKQAMTGPMHKCNISFIMPSPVMLLPIPRVLIWSSLFIVHHQKNVVRKDQKS